MGLPAPPHGLDETAPEKTPFALQIAAESACPSPSESRPIHSASRPVAWAMYSIQISACSVIASVMAPTSMSSASCTDVLIDVLPARAGMNRAHRHPSLLG